MFREDFQTTAIGSLALIAVSFVLPQGMVSVEAATPEASPAVIGQPLSSYAISEEKVGKKTFITSRVLVNATPAKVWEVLTDYDGAAHIFSNLAKSKLISSSGATRLVKFTARSRGKLLKFEYTLAVTERHRELIEWKRVDGAFKANEGYWKLEPFDGGEQTLVTYAKYVDGGLLLPQVLVKKLVRDSIPVIFTEVKSAAEQHLVSTNRP